MAILIDSSVFIALERRGLPIERTLTLVGTEEAALASITAAELLFGVHRSDSPARRLRRETFVEALLDALPVLPFDLRAARVYARLAVQITTAGQPIGAHDLQIGATALAHNVGVLTWNVRDFQRVPGLVVQQPNW
jgi:tRNA(fMet)-specific endonuclease VapC